MSGQAGTYSGVAAIATVPTRALGSPWPLDMFETGRVQVVGSFVNHMWISGGILYGYPQSKTHPCALERTNALLDHLVDHMLLHASGPRYLCGDWNSDTKQLPATRELAEHGWQEVQDIEFLRNGVKPQMTCKQVTQRDYLWLSPELVACYNGLTVESETFPDHSSLLATFVVGRQFSRRFLWPSPAAVPWNQVDCPQQPLDFSVGDPTDHYGTLWKSCEAAAAAQLSSWTSAMGGRGQRLEPLVKTGWPSPTKVGRSVDLQPAFFGYDVQHSRWMKQLRRLHNFVNCARVHRHTGTPATWDHGLSLWRSILRAPGFSPSFQVWWANRQFVGLGDPGWIPSSMPDAQLAGVLCEVFCCEVRYLESQLQQNRKGHRRWKHTQDPNCIFQDTKRPPPETVSSLLECARSSVAEVDTEDVAVVLDPPCVFDDAKPVQVATQAVSIIHATDTKLYLASVDGIEVGHKLSQSSALGSLDVLFAAFREQWQQRWCKHDSLPHTHWSELVGFARRFVPTNPLCSLCLSPKLLRAEVGRKHKRTAAGLDGVTRLDLLQANDATMQSLCNLVERATTDGAWPKQVISGRVSSLAKTLDAAEVNQFRPITVFSLVYRCFSSVVARFLLDWADQWAHPDVFGNRKGHQTGHLWRTLVSEIQVAHDQGLPLSGITADIEKCYNCLPRYPILAIAVHCGVPLPTVVAWSGALAGMQRRFKIRDSFSGACTTSTGLAEGCALSCFGMLLLDDVLHRYVHAMNPSVRVLSFVGNWDFLTFDTQASLVQLDLLLDFARLADLTVDRKNTFGWSTDAATRGLFRRHAVPVKHHARDLGAHVAFTRQRTNRTVTDRLADLEPLWEQLRHSKASFKSKIRALRTVAWPRGLFGVASAPVGRAVWLRCRRSATKALSFNKPGVNPAVLLGVVESSVDPEFVALVQTVADTREHCSREFWTSELFPVAIGSLPCPPSSPTMVLLERLQTVGLSVRADGTWVDEIGCFQPWQIGHAELYHGLQWAWQKHVAAQVAHRSDFDGLARVDALTTRVALSSLPVDQQALFRLGLSGGLFTQNAHSHWNGASDACRWCGQTDSLHHQYYICPQFGDLRANLAPDVIRLRDSLPPVLALRGWAVHPSTHLQWCRLLDSLSRAVPQLGCPLAFDTDGWNHVFTDGSCLWQSNPAYRVAAWGAVLAVPPSAQWSLSVRGVLGAGPLPGICQTSYRSELYALGFVLHHAAQGGFRVKIYCDCLGVINKFYLLTQGKRKLRKTSSSTDLWQWVLDSVERLGMEKICLHKTAAHRRLQSATTRQELWLYWNNGAADRVAKSANLDRTRVFWTFWETHAACVAGAKEIHRQIVALHMAVAMRSVAAEAAVTLDEAEPEQPQPVREFDMEFQVSAWTGQIPLEFSQEYGSGLSRKVTTWWSERIKGASTTEPRWVSFAHLYIDYQLTWGCAGPIKTGRSWADWATRPYIEPERNDFLLRVKWFRRCLKVF